jgi:hypothetical protein
MGWGSVAKDGTVFIDFMKPAVKLFRDAPVPLKVGAAIAVAGVALYYTYRRLFGRSAKPVG